ncbi:hypothetical protein NIES267_73950 (plasmid) [Calothrix parasitica NIES-267]|uniref:Uncharacterized protein n=1 Tax=Calothrix parasitica NIES-267 TaxID=1973488 RepID=A0A1Z4M3A8_9CYAN|nr:hypothetical protein NIES267_73950 [Calothrix parasitica NIES-267]
MPKVQKNLVNFLKKNIVLAITLTVLVTSFISVSAMEIIAPEEFKPSKGVQEILSLNNEKNGSQIAKSEEIESESSSVASSFSSSVMSSSVSQEESSEKTVNEPSSVSSSSKQQITSSRNLSSYSASISSSISSNSTQIKSSSSNTSVQYTTKKQGSPLCGINEEYPEIANKQRQTIADTRVPSEHGKIGVLFNTNIKEITSDTPFYLQENKAYIHCYTYRSINRIPGWISPYNKRKEECNTLDIRNLEKLLQISNGISTFDCIKVKKQGEPRFYVYSKEIDELYRISIANTNEPLSIKEVFYYCDVNEDIVERDWIRKSQENAHLCDKNLGM